MEKPKTDKPPVDVPSEYPAVLARCSSIVVTDDRTYRIAATALLEVKSMRNEIAKAFDPAIKDAFKAHRSIVALKKKAEDGLDIAELYLKEQLKQYFETIETENKAAADSAMAVSDEESLVLPQEREIPKVEGISTRINWKWKVTDLKAFVKAVADGKIPLDAIKTNDTFINGEVKKKRSALGYDGIETFPDRGIAGSPGRE
jgi:hypothetical protein